VYKPAAADIDRSMVDALACIAVEEQQIAALQIIDRLDQRPTVVFGIGMCTAAADRHTRFFQTVVDETGTVERVGTFVAENVWIAELILSAADHAVNAVCISGIVSRRRCFGRLRRVRRFRRIRWFRCIRRFRRR